MKLPDEKDHINHLTGEMSGVTQQVDPLIISKIHQLVSEGVNNVDEMERHINIYKKNELFQGKSMPSTFNRRWSPTRQDFANHIYSATMKNRMSKVDQENVSSLIDQWKKDNPNDMFFFRQYDSVSEEMRLLLVHQTNWQKRLLQLYGNIIVDDELHLNIDRHSLQKRNKTCAQNQRRRKQRKQKMKTQKLKTLKNALKDP